MGLDLWFPQDVARILASTHETMAASTRALQGMQATAPLDAEMAETYRQGFVDALRAVAVAFGVGAPSVGGRGAQTAVQVELQRDGFRTLDAGEWR